MNSDQVVCNLMSPSLDTRSAETYRLDYDDFGDDRVRNAVRANLDADHADLVEISIMRLLVRGKDVQSADRVRSILATCHDDLIFCAAVSALTNLGYEFPQTANATLEAFEALPRSHIPADRLAMFDKSCTELRRISG